MRWPIAILLLLPILALAVPSKHVLIGKVVKVTDGDTIVVLTDYQDEGRIKLWGIVKRPSSFIRHANSRHAGN